MEETAHEARQIIVKFGDVHPSRIDYINSGRLEEHLQMKVQLLSSIIIHSIYKFGAF